MVVAPSATWMAEQMATGSGVGTTFSEPTADSVVTALLQALRDSHRLGALARSLFTSGTRIQVNDILNE